MSTTSNVPAESKTARKRKVKTEPSAAVSTPDRESPALETAMNGLSVHDTSNNAHDSPYLRELGKSIRNLTKKLSASSKADQIVEQNPGVSIDDLLAQKKLNADQKAQLLKKPQLQAQLAQLEEQQKNYSAFANEIESKFAAERTTLIESHEKALAQANSEAAESASAAQSSQLEQGLKVITGFLHAAAAKRQSDDTDSEEARAFEGALLLVYQGNSSSLNTLRQLVQGSDEKVPDTENNSLEYTFAQIREAALKHTASLSDENELVAEAGAGADAISSGAAEPASDPTIANAGLTELEDTNAAPMDAKSTEQSVVPEQASIGAEAANAVAEANWDPQSSAVSSQTPTGEDWVQVPRDPAETEQSSAQPAVSQSTTNWADEAGDAAADQKAAAAENDGFEQVRRDRGRGRGGPRGRGYDGRGRGRGRGEHRGRGGPGRGRGGPRGDRGAAPTS